jgi:hypothetical protein
VPWRGGDGPAVGGDDAAAAEHAVGRRAAVLVGGDPPLAVAQRLSRVDDVPPAFRGGLVRRRVQHEVGACRAQRACGLGEVAVEADAQADAADPGDVADGDRVSGPEGVGLGPVQVHLAMAEQQVARWPVDDRGVEQLSAVQLGEGAGAQDHAGGRRQSRKAPLDRAVDRLGRGPGVSGERGGAVAAQP